MNIFQKISYIYTAIINHTVDIHSKAPGAGGRLSNFTKRRFVFDGVECQSIEGVLQSFKFSDAERQKEICAFFGSDAKKAGAAQEWKITQTLYWKGIAYKRDSTEYQRLLNSLYQEVFIQDSRFVDDLCRLCRGWKFTHSIGCTDLRETVLTSDEFCERLTKLSSSYTAFADGSWVSDKPEWELL